MELSRWIAAAIAPQAKAEALHHFGVDAASLLATGTEAEVYALDEERVLKLYADTDRASQLGILRTFYDSLQTAELEFALPRILEIKPFAGIVAVIERRIAGRALSEILPALSREDALAARRTYVDAVVALAKVRAPSDVSQFLLFDDSKKSSVRSQDWHQFIYRLADVKLARQRAALAVSVRDLGRKHARLRDVCLAHKYDGPLKVVHGDFFPGNLLMSAPDRASGVIDFGSFTMFGDPLYDVALACVLFDMYSPNRVDQRHDLLTIALNKIGDGAEGRLYRYAMAYALMSCDLYARPSALMEDDHYKWCVELLNTASYWDRMQ